MLEALLCIYVGGTIVELVRAASKDQPQDLEEWETRAIEAAKWPRDLWRLYKKSKEGKDQ